MPAAVVEVERRNADVRIVSKVLGPQVGMDRTNFAASVALRGQFSKSRINTMGKLFVLRSNMFQAFYQHRFPPPISTPARRRIAEGACRFMLEREGASPFLKERPIP